MALLALHKKYIQSTYAITYTENIMAYTNFLPLQSLSGNVKCQIVRELRSTVLQGTTRESVLTLSLRELLLLLEEAREEEISCDSEAIRLNFCVASFTETEVFRSSSVRSPPPLPSPPPPPLSAASPPSSPPPSSVPCARGEGGGAC